MHLPTSASTTNAVSSNFLQTFGYNALGNITSKSDIGSYTYAGNSGSNYANPHAPTGIASNTLTYDSNGNLLTFSNRSYTWNYRNELINTSSGAGTTTSLYDESGNRISYTDTSSVTKYPTPEYAHETVSDTKTKYIYAGEDLVATIDTAPTMEMMSAMSSISVDTEGETSSSTCCVNEIPVSHTIHYIHTDHLTGSNVVTDANGALEETLDYYPFGQVRLDNTVTGFQEKHKFAGQIFDSQSELNYMNARFQDGKRGQFLSQDPAFLSVGNPYELKSKTGLDLQVYLSDPQGMNSYSYAKNNSLKYVDQDGNFWQAIAVLGIMYAPQILSFGQSLLTPLGQVGMSQAVDDARNGNYTMAAIGALTAGEFSGSQKAISRLADTNDGLVKFATEYGRNLDFQMSQRSWSVGNVGDRLGSLVDHYLNHGEKVGAKSVGEYYGKANSFISNKEYTNVFREGADTVYYNEKTKFAAYTNKAGDISSFYKLTSQNKINNYLKRIKSQK